MKSPATAAQQEGKVVTPRLLGRSCQTQGAAHRAEGTLSSQRPEARLPALAPVASGSLLRTRRPSL
eukprot:scaffold21699_cov78-Phaeocystis_antarctica.AAC.5